MRNGKIELYRFIFAIYVVICHVYKVTIESNDLFRYSAIATEFFFITSGYLLAKTISSLGECSDLTSETIFYLKKKLRSFSFEYVISYIFVFFAFHLVVQNDKKLLTDILECIPDFLLLRQLGWSHKLAVPNGPTWYLSILIFSIIIIYPLCRKWNYFNRLGTLFVGVFLIGMVRLKYNSLVTPAALIFGDVFLKGTVRGFAEICLGIYSFHLTNVIRKTNFTLIGKIALSILEVSCFLLSSAVIILSKRGELNIIGLIAIIGMVVLGFSEKTLFSAFFNKKYFLQLGNLSMPIFLSHMFVVYVAKYIVVNSVKIIPEYIVTLAVVLLSIVLGILIKNLANYSKSQRLIDLFVKK